MPEDGRADGTSSIKTHGIGTGLLRPASAGAL